MLRDITEKVKLEKMRQDFVANVSHEIRTPLSMMQGYSEALLDGMAASPEESQELIQVIHDESLRMGRLVKDLLDLARMEAGHTDIQRRRVDVNEMLERVYRKFSVRAKENGIELIYDKKTSDLVLEAADEDKLEQVLTNLLDNAFRHTPGANRSGSSPTGRRRAPLPNSSSKSKTKGRESRARICLTFSSGFIRRTRRGSEVRRTVRGSALRSSKASWTRTTEPSAFRARSGKEPYSRYGFLSKTIKLDQNARNTSNRGVFC
ncbi:Sensor protein SrrB [Paenibacillus sp. P1XP2]|nr:Sensor protein SrrB [Paenibacillus sp. P1XP2]